MKFSQFVRPLQRRLFRVPRVGGIPLALRGALALWHGLSVALGYARGRKAAHMTGYCKPTKEQVRHWTEERVKVRKPLPSLEEIRRQIGWDHVEMTCPRQSKY